MVIGWWLQAGGGGIPVEDSSGWTAPRRKSQIFCPLIALGESEEDDSYCNEEANEDDECVGIERDQDSVGYARWR